MVEVRSGTIEIDIGLIVLYIVNMISRRKGQMSLESSAFQPRPDCSQSCCPEHPGKPTHASKSNDSFNIIQWRWKFNVWIFWSEDGNDNRIERSPFDALATAFRRFTVAITLALASLSLPILSSLADFHIATRQNDTKTDMCLMYPYHPILMSTYIHSCHIHIPTWGPTHPPRNLRRTLPRTTLLSTHHASVASVSRPAFHWCQGCSGQGVSLCHLFLLCFCYVISFCLSGSWMIFNHKFSNCIAKWKRLSSGIVVAFVLEKSAPKCWPISLWLRLQSGKKVGR